MSQETEKKILKAALKIFAKEGYVGAKTRLIAEEAGFSEMTLFRKFKSKENLFFTVLIVEKELMLKELSALSRENKIEDPILSLRYLINAIYRLIDENFPCISIYINENRMISECILDDFMIYLAAEIKIRFPDDYYNAKNLAHIIISSLYHLVFDKYKNYSIVIYEETLDVLIDCAITFLTVNRFKSPQMLHGNWCINPE